jgi:3-hydroxyacyl-CoA dehydrogenase
MERTVARADGRYRAVVIYNEGRFFCTGGNLGHILMLANGAAWDRLDAFGARGQAAFNALKYAPFPVIGAPAGRALGGGCEVLLHCDGVQAHTETYMGLVELGVGLLPAWGGCKELLQRAAASGPGGPMAAAVRAFEVIATASVSTSAQHAQELGYLRRSDRVTPNRDRLLADARAFALELADGYQPPERPMLTVAGPSGRATLELTSAQRAPMVGASPYDLELVGRYAWVLTGGDADPVEPVPESRISQLELEAIGGLIRRPQTVDRIGHMLATGKPLRN